jgi:hypothetical protein
MAEGKTVITLSGIKALTLATTLGKQVKPVYFKVSDQDIGDIYPGINISDLPSVWYQANISGVIPVNDHTVEFILDIPPDKATKYGKTFGLYLGDGTLFAVAKPPYPFPPLMRQRFKVQFVWQQIESVMSFEDLPFYEFDQDVYALSGFSVFGKALLEDTLKISLLEGKLRELEPQVVENQNDINILKGQIEGLKQELFNLKVAVFDAVSLLGKAILELSQKVSLLGGKL